jgi:hypothetical protein
VISSSSGRTVAHQAILSPPYEIADAAVFLFAAVFMTVDMPGGSTLTVIFGMDDDRRTARGG